MPADIKNTIDFLENKITRLQDYHNHKENMVNAGFLVQLTLFSTIIMEDVWPPQWISGMALTAGLSTLFVYFLFWLMLHYFISWQLQNKLIASLYINGYESSLRKLIFEPIQNLDQNVKHETTNENNREAKSKKKLDFFRHLFPFKKISIQYDININGLPHFIAKEINDSISNGTAAKTHESLMILGSLLMLCLASARIISLVLS